MRARYSAYVKGLVEFIVDTTHPENPLADGGAAPAGTTRETLKADVRATCQKISWERLKVLSSEQGPSDDEACVTFQTWFKVKDQQGKRAQGWKTQSFVEKSKFRRDTTGRWLYLDGEQTDWKN
jgi:SEC-C motif-containing protein